MIGENEAPNTDAYLLTAEEVSQRLHVPKTWVYRAAREERLPTVRLGRYRRFRAEAIDSWLQKSER